MLAGLALLATWKPCMLREPLNQSVCLISSLAVRGRLHHILLSVGADRMLRLWDALEGRLVLEVYTAHRLGESIVSLACRQDNKYIATGDSSGWMKVCRDL